MILPMEGDEASGWKPGKPTVFLNSSFSAYQSNESGQDEVYVRSFPGGGGKSQISTDGGTFPAWSRTRPELFYGAKERTIMVVPYSVEGDLFHPERPRLWSEGRFRVPWPFRPFDLHPDGQRFALAPDAETEAKHDEVVLILISSKCCGASPRRENDRPSGTSS